MEEAFAAYEAVRHRLPAGTRSAACQSLPDLDALADDVDVFLLDAFGVLNIGETAIPGVPERVAGPSKGRKARHRCLKRRRISPFKPDGKYARLGYNFDPEDVITSRKTLLNALAQGSPT